ncbi:MAG: PD-(D/E)XK nuclease family protein [Coleofasciculaceae cyanobacterium]
MAYLTEADDIRAIISQFTSAKTIWADTEVADWDTPNPRLSLIQILADPADLTGDRAYILDVLDKPELVADFVNQIMANSQIEKVFHFASYDLQYVGGNGQAKNVTCTFKLVNKLTKKRRRNPLVVSNKKLKTLAVELCQFSQVDTEQQTSDWGQRPLTEQQLKYAKMDTVYLAHVHRRLLEIRQQKIEEAELFAQQQSQQPEHPPLSVTKVRVAFECPRLFYLKDIFNGNTLFVPINQPVSIGMAFHRLSEQCVRTLQQNPQLTSCLKPTAEQLKIEEITDHLKQELEQLVVYPYLKANPEIGIMLPQVQRGLTTLIETWVKFLVVNRHYCSAEEVINKTFLSKERNLKCDFTLPDGTVQRVAGRSDNIIGDLKRDRLYVVDYKTNQPVNPLAQLAQVALYSYMISKKRGVLVEAKVYCFLPEFKEYSYTSEQLEEAVANLISPKLQQMKKWQSWQPGQPNPPEPTSQPYLCEICPQQQKCQSFF